MPDIWHWQPNTISESLEFQTDIRRSRTTEIRDSLKDATQFLGLNYIISQSVSEGMISLAGRNATGLFDVPDWPLASFVRSGTIDQVTPVISVDDESLYPVAARVFLSVGDTYETGVVASTAAGQITLQDPLVNTFAGSQQAPVVVAPLRSYLMTGDFDFAKAFAKGPASIEFLCVEPIDLAANPYDLHDGLPFVDDGSIPFAALSGSAGRAKQIVASSHGAYEAVETEEYSRRRGTLSFFDKSFADRLVRRRFIHFMRGRDGEMWVPTNQNDLKLIGNISQFVPTIDVVPFTEPENMVGVLIAIQEGGQKSIKEISAAVDITPTRQRLTIGATFQNFSADAVVSVMTKMRFDTDRLDFRYVTTGAGLYAGVTAAVIEVP